jgi:subtilisin family serine protease
LPAPPAAAEGAFAPGRVLVGWKPSVAGRSRLDLLAGQGWQTLRSIDELATDIVAVPEGQELAAVAVLQADPAVAYAEPDYLAYAAGRFAAPVQQSNPPLSVQGVQPNDTFWSAQWSLRRMQLPLAWTLNQGVASVVVAVIDSGIDLSHPEFAGRLQSGFDYVEWDTVPQDQYGHGTHISGVIAAAGNNGLGVAGSAWNVQLAPLRVLDRNGAGTASNIAQAIVAAANRRVQVINLSLALSGPSVAVQNAIVAAHNNGILVVAATGNDSQPGQPLAPVSYPAAYPDVVAVAATTRWEERASYSNGGPQVTVAAPGGEASDPVYSASLNGGYAMLYGTSIAAAHVSGTAALLRGYAPQWSAAAVRDALRNTAAKVGSTPYVAGRNDLLGHGRVDAAASLRWSIAPFLSLTPESPYLLAAAGQPLPTATVTLGNQSQQPLSWQITSVSPGWLRVDLPWSGSVAYPDAPRLQVGLYSLPPSLGQNWGSIGLRTTDPFGQQRDFMITVRVQVVSQLRQVYLPSVGQGALTAGWVNVTDGGLGLQVGDDGVQTVPLAFSFPFYGRTYSQAFVHANGFISFGASYPGSAYAFNHCLPNIMGPNGAIFALWDDLDPSQGGSVAYRSTASYLAVEWRDVPHKSGGVSTFQVILLPSGQMRINYGSTVQSASATVGAESWDASFAWPVACNNAGAPPVSGQSLLWNAALP